MKYYFVLALLGMFILLGVAARVSSRKRLRNRGPRIDKETILRQLNEKQRDEKG